MGAAASQRGNKAIRQQIESEYNNRQYGQAYVDSLNYELQTTRAAYERQSAEVASIGAELDKARDLINRLRAERNVLRDELQRERTIKAIHNSARKAATERLAIVTEERNTFNKALRRRLLPDEYREALAFERE